MANTQRIVDNIDGAELDGSDLEALTTDVIKDQETNLPAKFQGKSVEDIVASYENLEKELGRQGNELGELRKLSDKLIIQGLDQRPATPVDQVEEKELTEEEYLNDPLSTVQKLVQEAVKPLKETIQATKEQQNSSEIELRHPDAKEIIQEKEFQDWVLASNGRQKMWGQASDGDVDLADELFSAYKREHKTETNTDTNTEETLGATTVKENEELDAATSIGSGKSVDIGAKTTGKTYSRAALINLMLENPNRYAALQPELVKAYSEGRVV